MNARDDNGSTPLHVASSAAVAEKLLQPGANVNAKNADGETPIFDTSEAASPVLIRYGADLKVRNKKNSTVWEAAASWGTHRQEMILKALQAAHPNR